EDGIRDFHVTGVQTCSLPISSPRLWSRSVTWYPAAPYATRSKPKWDRSPEPAKPADTTDPAEAGAVPAPPHQRRRGTGRHHQHEIGRASCRERRSTTVGAARP